MGGKSMIISVQNILLKNSCEGFSPNSLLAVSVLSGSGVFHRVLRAREDYNMIRIRLAKTGNTVLPLILLAKIGFSAVPRRVYSRASACLLTCLGVSTHVPRRVYSRASACLLTCLFFAVRSGLWASQVPPLAVADSLASVNMHKVVVVDLPRLNIVVRFEVIEG
jgi:hypothetical protein